MLRRTLLAAALAVMPLAAAPTLTTIQDVLYKADGTRFSGTLTVSWTSFVAADNSSIATQSTTFKVIDGNLRVQLVPTTTSNPPITYSVIYNSDGKVQFQETWSVPVSATPVRVRDVRVASAAGSSTGGGSLGADTDSVTESQVTGLIADLGARPVKGPGYTAGRVAVVNSSGAVESAIGTLSDCVHVDGSSGPCGGSGTTPSFIDGEVPTGIVDGSNGTFLLSAVPDPAASLAVYRNGILMKATFDYTLTGNSVAFITAATPQPGDTLLASYRTDAGAGSTSTTTYSSPQVLCSGAGRATSAAALANLGTCAVAAGVLAAGDRVEIRFDYAHTGASGGFSIEAHWGATTLLHRDSPNTETLLTGRADSSILANGSQLSSQTWGAAGSMVTAAGTATDAYSTGVTITLLGSVAQAADSLTLANFSVVRIP